MKKIIFALVAIMCGVCAVNAGEMQDFWCEDESLSYCIKHYDKQCDAKNYGACVTVGILHYELEQYSESKKYFELVCDKANSKDSFQFELIDGSLTPKHPAIKAMQLTCGVLAKYYSNGFGVRQDKSKALQYNKKACGLGEAESCAWAGREYFFGKNVKQDLKLAKSYFEKSCEMQNGLGCWGLGVMYGNGEGVPKNLSKAKEYFGKACDFGEQVGCDYYKKLNERGVR
ncbi:tetratricopeptide repeat protein [Helicobacter sp. 23-1044]